jgi:hypothetical protein
VVEVDEFATSALCSLCGYALSHPKHPERGQIHGVSFCSNRSCTHFMVNRDTDAAFKIAYVWMARALGYDLGPFSRANYVKGRHRGIDPATLWADPPPGTHSMRELYECRSVVTPNGKEIAHRIICTLPLTRHSAEQAQN